MAIYSGVSSKLGLAIQDTWGTAKTTLSSLYSFTAESLKLVREKKEEPALVGAVTTGRLDAMARKATGDVSGLVKPDEIGYWLAATLGKENTDLVVGATSTYVHTFTAIKPGPSATLPMLTIVVDRVIGQFVYEGSKINQMKLSAKVQDYIQATFSLICRDENSATSTYVLPARSTLKALRHLGGKLKVNGQTLAEVTGVDLTYSNNLEDNLYVMDGNEQMAEIQPQKRDITLDIECLRTDTTEEIRTDYYLTDDDLSVELTFESDELIETGQKYRIIIEIPHAYLTDDPSQGVGGPERLKMKLSLRASEQSNDEPITIKLYNKRSTDYLS